MEKKLRVLCLHGYRQDAEKLRHQTGSLRKILKKHIEMEFVSAPHFVPGEEDSSRSWWFTTNNSFSSRDDPEICTGLDDSIKLIEETWKNKGPFDGLLGFSQGACLVGIIAGLYEMKTISVAPKFLIFISGFMSKCHAHKKLYENPKDIPSLHVFGEEDEVIPWELSQTLSEKFTEPKILRHSGGHFIGGTVSNKLDYQSFFKELRID